MAKSRVDTAQGQVPPPPKTRRPKAGIQARNDQWLAYQRRYHLSDRQTAACKRVPLSTMLEALREARGREAATREAARVELTGDDLAHLEAAHGLTAKEIAHLRKTYGHLGRRELREHPEVLDFFSRIGVDPSANGDGAVE